MICSVQICEWIAQDIIKYFQFVVGMGKKKFVQF